MTFGLLLALVVPCQDWPQARGDAQNTGAVRLRALESSRASAWTFEGSGRVWSYTPGMSVWTSAAAAVVDGRAVVAVGSYDHNVYVLDAASGDLLWKLTTGEGVYASPTFWNAGDAVILYASSSDRLVYALDAESGRRLWIHSVAEYRPTLGGARLTSPVVGRVGDRDAVFVGHWVWDRSLTQNFQESGITALDARLGTVLWRSVLGDNEVTAPVFAGFPDGARRLFLASADGNTMALDADSGSVVWRETELDAVRGAPALAVSPAGPRVVTASRSGILRCMDAGTGAELWRYRTGDWITGSPVATVVHARHLVVVGSYDRSVYAVDLLSGQLVWRYFGRGGFYSGIAAITSGSRAQVVAPAWDHHLHGIDARDGSPLWEAYTGRPIWDTVGLEHSTWSAPTAVEINGRWTIFFGSYDGTFYALPLAELAGGRARQRSNVGFWVSFPIALGMVAGVALVLTRRTRRRAISARPPGPSDPSAGAG